MTNRKHAANAILGLLAALGITLAVQAQCTGGLFRYALLAAVLGALLCVPLASVLLLRERARRFWKRCAFVLLPSLVLLALTELAVRQFAPPRESDARLLPDARLGHVLEPGRAGLDAGGFRNEGRPERTDVLFVGDSQTWGFHVDRDATMSAVFAARSGARSYQMANGSYGPVQYRELLRAGLAMQPKLVVVVLYFGNDLVDARDYAGLEGAEDVRSPGLQYRVRHNPEFDGTRAPNWAMAIVDGVLVGSRVLDFAANVVKARLRGGLLDQQAGALPFDDARVGTILLPEYRRPLVDRANPHVDDGLAITGRCLVDMVRRCREVGAQCVLLAIPTKEFAYQHWLLQRGAGLPQLAPLHAAESGAREALFAMAAQAGLPVLDFAARAAEELGAGKALWQAGGDGHITAVGHAVAAELVLRHWRTR